MHRGSRPVRDLIVDLPAEALRWRPMPAGDDPAMTSLAGLTAHMAGAAHFWASAAIGEQAPILDREGESATHPQDAAEQTYLLERTASELA